MKNFNGFVKGVNLGGWFSQCDYSKERLDGYVTREDVKKIASWGADHVRLPIDYNILQNSDGTPKQQGYAYIDGAIEMCEKENLNVVLDLHKTAGYSFDKGENEVGFFDSEEYQERFYAIWREMSKRYGNKSNVAFELLNEITDQSFCDKWNQISCECIRRIRTAADKTVILVGGYWNNSVAAVKDIAAPYDDLVVYNCHCYDPLKFTHQLAPWVDPEREDCTKKMSYAECGFNGEKFIEHFAIAADHAKKNGTVLYCGEYGVIDRVDPKDALQWFKDINAAFNYYNIGRSVWNYKEMDFGLSDEWLKGTIEELVKYL